MSSRKGILMPFIYRMQKILEIRISKKEEQLRAVIRAQEEVNRIELLIIKNLEQIKETTAQMRSADPMMYETYDKFIKHLWEEDEKLKNQKKEAEIVLEKEKELLKLREQEVDVLEKHKEHQKEDYIKEVKARELKELNEIGSQKYYIKSKERQEETELEELYNASNTTNN